MPQQGSNLPDFREQQLDFASHIRHPSAYPAPVGIEPRRMRIYLDLVYNNIERVLARSFPVSKKVLGADRWHEVVRDYVHRHPSQSPYFLEIPQEFLTFLDQAGRDDLPGFLLELCHYEWVELALSVADEEIPTAGIDPHGDLLRARVVVSPLIWPLSYRYPVHQIGPGNQPDAPPDERTHLVVYRRRDDSVGFLEANALTLELLQLLGVSPSGGAALERLVEELPGLDSQVIHDQGLATMQRLREAQIIIGVEASGAP